MDYQEIIQELDGELIINYLCRIGNIFQLKLTISGNRKSPLAPIGDDWYCFRIACENGHIDVLKYLFEFYSQAYLKNILTDICNVKNNYCIRYACLNGHIDIVKFLTENHKQKIDITANENQAFRWCCMNGHLELIKYLLENYKEIDITSRKCDGFRMACELSNNNTIIFLLDNYFDQMDFLHNAYVETFNISCEVGNIEMIEYIIQKDLPDMERIYDNGFIRACIKKCIITIKYLKELLNNTQFKYYCYVGGHCCIIKPKDIKMSFDYIDFFLILNEFEFFNVFCNNEECMDKCIEEYKVHYESF